MSNEEINDREYNRLMEEIGTMANSEHVLSVVEQLELVYESKCIAREIKALEASYRDSKEGR